MISHNITFLIYHMKPKTKSKKAKQRLQVVTGSARLSLLCTEYIILFLTPTPLLGPQSNMNQTSYYIVTWIVSSHVINITRESKERQ